MAINVRLSHFRNAFCRPAYRWGALGVPAVVVQLAAFLRDNFGSTDQQSAWKLMSWLPRLHWQSWAIFWLVLAWCVLFEGSFRRYRGLEAERKITKEQLSKIEQKRDLTYQNSNFNISQHTLQSDMVLHDVRIILENLGDYLLEYKVLDFFLERNGSRTAPLMTGAQLGGFVHARQSMTHSFGCPVPFSIGTVPNTFRLGFTLAYDNVPAVGERITERVIEFTMTSLTPTVISNRIVSQSER